MPSGRQAAIAHAQHLQDGDGIPEIVAYLGFTAATEDVVFFSSIVPGDVDATAQRVASILHAPAASAISGRSVVWRGDDLDGDGLTEQLLNTHPLASRACVGYALGRETRSISDHDWLFENTARTQISNVCFAAELGVSGAADLVVHYLDYPSFRTSELAVYLGPFPAGSYDLALHPAAIYRFPIDVYPNWYTRSDFDGDGVNDLVFHWAPATQPMAAGVSIFFGPLSPGNYDALQPDASIQDTDPTSRINQLTAVGDVDGDGFTDLALAATARMHDGIVQAGEVLLFKGPFARGTVLQAADADSVITWPHILARTGHYVRALGDVDGDGLDEFAVVTWASRNLTPASVDLTVRWPPDDTSVPDTYVVDTGWPRRASAEGAIMVFGDPPPGVVGPNEAKFTIMDSRPGALIGSNGITGLGDVDGDGMADFAYSAFDGADFEIVVVHPCSDFGTPVP